MLVLVLPEVTDDDNLLSRARRGDKAAVSEIYRRHVESIYQFVRLRIGDAQAAEDITSTVFEKLINGLAHGKGPDQHVRGWLFQVARNAIHESYSQQQTLPLDAIEQWASAGTDGLEQQVIQSLTTEAVTRLIASLSPDQQEILLLRFDQQLSLQETAAIVGKTVNTVKALQFRAVNRLRQLLQSRKMEGLGYG